MGLRDDFAQEKSFFLEQTSAKSNQYAQQHEEQYEQ